MSAGKERPRVRWTLLILLWVWAIGVFTVIDLFLNVEKLDAVRPRANLYRGMRIAAHKMVGEPLLDEEVGRVEEARRMAHRTERPQTDAAAALAAELAAVRASTEMELLRERTAEAEDPRARIVALRELARRFGSGVRATLLATARDEDETLKVRKQAARFLGWTGGDADRDLERIRESKLPQAVRAGAVLGLGELGSAAGAERLLGYAADPKSPLRADALRAIATLATQEAAPLLREAARNVERKADTRTAACRALVRLDEPATARALADVLADASNPPEVRAMAAKCLGWLGRREALAVVTTASRDSDPEVARQARLAMTRLQHVRVQ